MLRMKNVCAGYEGRDVLHNVTLKACEGQITAIVGPNGCGKSTLLKTMAGILPKSAGELWIGEKSLEAYRNRELAQKLAYLPQNRNLPEITVLRMVLHGRFPYLSYPRNYKKEDYQIAIEALHRVGMEAFAEKNISELSGGMQQKVYIAMALAQDTSLVLMDEPTTFLDISCQLRLMETVRALADQGKAVVLVLHDLALALKTADRLILLKEGNVVKEGTTEELYQSGLLDTVFQMKIRRVQTEEGWQYYYLSGT